MLGNLIHDNPHTTRPSSYWCSPIPQYFAGYLPHTRVSLISRYVCHGMEINTKVSRLVTQFETILTPTARVNSPPPSINIELDNMASLGEDLLGIVNKLQDLVFNTIGNDSLDLPQIVCCPCFVHVCRCRLKIGPEGGIICQLGIATSCQAMIPYRSPSSLDQHILKLKELESGACTN